MVTRGARRSLVRPPRPRSAPTKTAAWASLLVSLALVVAALLPIGVVDEYDLGLLAGGLALVVVWSVVAGWTLPARPGESSSAHAARRAALSLSLGGSMAFAVALFGMITLKVSALLAVGVVALSARVAGQMMEVYLTRGERRLQRLRDAEWRG
ncbi:hypothetical protein [Mumia quercus]|uniref:hypothetical protein n=1 Tax=Mumia quercus TaxID=2976125 RepID=UPI0021D026BA|nr:hypothetical protein [Mumia quercus]